MTDLSTTDIHDLRAWADAGYLPLPLYIEEVERRRKEQQRLRKAAHEASSVSWASASNAYMASLRRDGDLSGDEAAATAVAFEAIDPGGCAPPVYVDADFGDEILPECRGDLFNHPL